MPTNPNPQSSFHLSTHAIINNTIKPHMEMGSHGKDSSPLKPHYNITMSRRTRRPMTLKIEPQESFEEKEKHRTITKSEEEIQHQKSLKQLIEGRCSLAQHFMEEEEKQQDIVVRKGEDGHEGLKLKRILRNYAKVWTHMIKVKQESYLRSWKKSAPSLKLIKNK